MRSTIRYLFLAMVTVALTTVWSGTTAALVLPKPLVPAVTEVGPGQGEIVGIAHPVTMRFASPVTDRARAEQSVTIDTRRAEIGAAQRLPGTFSWIDDRTLEWVPNGLLPANARISISVRDVRSEFATNAGVFGEADMSAHTFTVSIGGAIVRTMPASMGKPGWETPSGTWPVLEKFRSIVFDSRTIGIPLSSPEGYLIDGEFAERLTWSGVFIHSAPWSVEHQGRANVSHGCINLAPNDAEWVYHTIGIGDPVVTHW
ncbi:L,D-transpeptidase family protein [Nocardia sp. CNY236]|uniref:L,D-transpeptidase n=1 Tax=Nocardia sp. CNY236 TaxID=1169152 RepID=UPI000400A325|nr:L,D-transpeptidase [Nocardia sp. CNY236]